MTSDDVFSEAQWRLFRQIPHWTSALSIVSSLFILQDILRDPLKRRRTYSRLLLGISSFDLIVSIMYFLAGWPIPEYEGTKGETEFDTTTGGDVGSNYNSNNWEESKIASQGTCTMQGFFIQTGIAIPIYYLGLALYYLLVLEYRWSDRKLRRMEYWVHAISITVGLGTAVAGLFLQLYNDADLWCWISSLPQECGNSPNADPDQEECERGSQVAWLYRWVFFYGPLWISLLAITLLMGRAAWHVSREEKKSRRWRESVANGSREIVYTKDKLRKLSSQVFWQSVHYVLALYVTWIFPTTLRLKQTMDREVSSWLMVCVVIFLPLQGVLNFSVYIRPRFHRFHKQHPRSSLIKVWFRTLRQRIPARRWLASMDASLISEASIHNSCDQLEADEPYTMSHNTTVTAPVSTATAALDSLSTSEREELASDQEMPASSKHSKFSNGSRRDNFSSRMILVQEEGDATKVNDKESSRQVLASIAHMEEDADVMDPAHQFLMLSQRELVLNSYATRLTSSRLRNIGCIEEGDEEESENGYHDESEGKEFDRRGLWYAMTGAAKTGLTKLKESARFRSSRRVLVGGSADKEVGNNELKEAAENNSSPRLVLGGSPLHETVLVEADDEANERETGFSSRPLEI